MARLLISLPLKLCVFQHSHLETGTSGCTLVIPNSNISMIIMLRSILLLSNSLRHNMDLIFAASNMEWTACKFLFASDRLDFFILLERRMTALDTIQETDKSHSTRSVTSAARPTFSLKVAAREILQFSQFSHSDKSALVASFPDTN